MASLTVTEFAGVAYVNGQSVAIMREPPIKASAVATSASASTAALQGPTRIVELVTDIGAWVLFGSSGSTVVATSTNATRYLANVPYQRAVDGYMRFTVIST